MLDCCGAALALAVLPFRTLCFRSLSLNHLTFSHLLLHHLRSHILSLLSCLVTVPTLSVSLRCLRAFSSCPGLLATQRMQMTSGGRAACMSAAISPPADASPQDLLRPVLFATSSFFSPTSFFHSLVSGLSSQLTLRSTPPSSPPLSSSCDLFRPGLFPIGFLLLAASSASPLSSLTACEDIDRRVARLKAAHKECLIVVLGQQPTYTASLTASYYGVDLLI